MTQEGQESPLPGDVKQVSRYKEEYRGSHIDQDNLMGIVIPRRRVTEHHERHRDELNIVDPGFSIHYLYIFYHNKKTISTIKTITIRTTDKL